MAFLDLAKGVLVLLMVVYHSLNYTNQYHLGFRYLPFLPPSFILITGFLLSAVYSPRYQAGDRKLIGRLLIRGAKLLLLFTALNIVAQFVRSPVYGNSIGVTGFFQRWDEIYVFGSGRAAAFEVLLPIAYLLLLAPLLIALNHRHALFLPITTAAVIALCVFLDFRGEASGNLNLLGSGLLGMLIGRLLPNPEILGHFLWTSLALYVVYLPFGVARGYVYIIQLAGACIALALICGATLKWNTVGWLPERVLRIGQYSLLSYIAQIAILQVLSRFFGRPDPWSVPGASLFILTLVLMTMLVESTEWIRRRSSEADKLYKAVFA